MKGGIMQPYFLPYIGYWQLINAVDKYVIYDNIQYTKKGWINRNRILVNEKDAYITIPLEKDSDYLNICDRKISQTFDKRKLLNQITGAYKKASYFDCSYKIIEGIINFENDNLFSFIYNSIQEICKYLNIQTEFIISSTISIDHSLKNQNKVLAICNNIGATEYINAIGGMDLYSKEEFKRYKIKLSFIKTLNIEYKQFNNPFIPNLSILDVLMFNSMEEINKMLDQYELI
jgi:hypothetical protein